MKPLLSPLCIRLLMVAMDQVKIEKVVTFPAEIA
jgi:hypothetical protein